MTDIPTEFIGKPTAPQYGSIWQLPILTSDRMRRFSSVLGAMPPTHRGSSAWLADGYLNFSQIFAYGTGVNYVSAPYQAGFNLTGDCDIRAIVNIPSLTATGARDIVTRWQANNCSLAFLIGTDGKLRLWSSTDGTGATATYAETTVVLPILLNVPVWLRVTRIKATGVTTFMYTYVANPGPLDWIVIGAPVVWGAGIALWSGNAAMEIGSQQSGSAQFQGGIARLQIRNNALDDGTGIVFDADFAAASQATPYATSFVATVGGTVTVELYPLGWTSNWQDSASLMRQNGGLAQPASGGDPYVGQWAEWWLPSPGRMVDGGVYVWTSLLKGPNCGIQRIHVNGAQIGADLDMYQATTWLWTATFWQIFAPATGKANDADMYKVRLTCTGKNAAATAQFTGYIAFMTLYGTAAT